MKLACSLANSEWWLLFRRYVQFCVVGATGVFVDMGVIYLFADPKMLNWNLTSSKLIAAQVALINNFVWNELWTFRELAAARSGWPQRLVRLLKFNLICAAGIGLSVLLLNVQVYGLGMNVYLSNFIAIVLVSLWNFLLNLKFGWTTAGGKFPPSTPDIDRGEEPLPPPPVFDHPLRHVEQAKGLLSPSGETRTTTPDGESMPGLSATASATAEGRERGRLT